MDAYKKWFDGIQRDDEVPEVVKNVVGGDLAVSAGSATKNA